MRERWEEAHQPDDVQAPFEILDRLHGNRYHHAINVQRDLLTDQLVRI